ncbi:MAG TPA: helix-turn-helix transcriptional regulator, partial [Candidatus Limnocylindrales bacterium]
MDAIRIGLSLRALRVRRAWRQIDLATRARVSRGTVSKVESGQLGGVSLEALARIAAVLEADLDVRIRWRGEHLDRLLDAGHARLVSVVAARLGRQGWLVAVEVTFSIWGERGSFDLLAFHPPSGSLFNLMRPSARPCGAFGAGVCGRPCVRRFCVCAPHQVGRF